MTLDLSLRLQRPGFSLDVSLFAPEGVTALFGRSGSGKTTVVNAVAGLVRPDAGRIVLNGRVLFDAARGIDLPPQDRALGYVFQDARLFPHLTVAQNLAYGRWVARLRRRRDEDGIGFDRVVDLLGIGPLLQRRPAQLSGGERQRVAIGRALLARPRILLMDEPLAALDAPRKAQILPYLESLRTALRLPVLYVSHDAAEVARLATTVVVMEGGRVRTSGPVAEMLASPEAVGAFGLREMGSLLTARVTGERADGLMRLETGAGTLWLPEMPAEPGREMRVRIHAQDVILSRGRPEGLSAQNVLKAVVTAVHAGEGPGALVRLEAGGQVVLARVTRRSVAALELAPGVECHAILKSVAVGKMDVGAALLQAGG